MLELGGKSPTIVHSSADIKSAARRIVDGRYSNAGQICTAPDHVLVWPDVKDAFVEHVVEAVKDFYGDEPQQSPDYGRIINRKSYRTSSRTARQRNNRRTEARSTLTTTTRRRPWSSTLSWDSPIMQEEVFGPILPVLQIESEEADAIDWVNRNPHPLGLYIFAEDHSVVDRILDAHRVG